jgi:D-lyxose ketol-isomerase
MFESGPDGEVDRSAPVPVTTDGQKRLQKPGEVLLLQPGESVTLCPGNWHKFWGEGGDVLIGEVSAVNDDLTDNIFEDPIGRFADVEEDAAPTHLLVSDYETYLT